MGMATDPNELIANSARDRAIRAQQFGVYIGRFNPPHVGHQKLIEKLISEFPERHLVLIGSCTEDPTLHNPFTYTQRISFLKKLHPKLNVVGLPDVKGNDDLWFEILKGMILHASGADVVLTARGWADKKVDLKEPLGSQESVIPVFFGGCSEDLKHFISWGYETHIVNRYETEEKMSSSEVKDCLVHGRSLEGKVDSRILREVQGHFSTNWNKILKGDRNA